MGSSFPDSAPGKQQADDPLVLLPCSTVIQVERGGLIYGGEHPSAHLYVVMAGTVRVSRTAALGGQVVIDVYKVNDFFGESTLLGSADTGESAVAMEKTVLMCWAGDEVYRLLYSRPKLGLELLRVMARREIEFAERLESFSIDSIPIRLAKSLIRFSERLGSPAADGAVTMRAFSQEFLAEYVGTSRELVNTTMNEWRRQELLTYSRKEITIRKNALREWINCNSIELR